MSQCVVSVQGNMSLSYSAVHEGLRVDAQQL